LSHKKKKKRFEAKPHRKVCGKILVIKLMFWLQRCHCEGLKTSFFFVALVKANHHRLHHS